MLLLYNESDETCEINKETSLRKDLGWNAWNLLHVLGGERKRFHMMGISSLSNMGNNFHTQPREKGVFGAKMRVGLWEYFVFSSCNHTTHWYNLLDFRSSTIFPHFLRNNYHALQVLTPSPITMMENFYFKFSRTRRFS